MSGARAMVLLSQFSRFVLVGGFSTALQYLILFALVRAAGVDPVVASSVGYALSAVANYDLNYRLTFRSRQPYLGGMARYAIVMTTGFVLNGLIMAAGTKLLGLHYLVAQVLATIVVLFWNFYAHRRWTY
jgi:putative flippase GtrA